MALNLLQRNAVIASPHARERIRRVAVAVAGEISIEDQPADDATPASKLRFNKRKRTADALLQYASNWIDRVFPRVVITPTLQDIAIDLTLDPAFLTSAREAEIEAALIDAIEGVFDTMIDLAN